MNASREFDCAGFHADLERRGLSDKLNDIDLLVGIADQGNRWTDDFIAEAVIKRKKEFLRKLLRDGYADEEGVHHESLCIKEVDPETGEVRKGYKQLEFFTVTNFDWAIRDEMRRIANSHEKIERLFELLRGKHGRRAERQLRLKLGFDEPAEVGG